MDGWLVGWVCVGGCVAAWVDGWVYVCVCMAGCLRMDDWVCGGGSVARCGWVAGYV